MGPQVHRPQICSSSKPLILATMKTLCTLMRKFRSFQIMSPVHLPTSSVLHPNLKQAGLTVLLSTGSLTLMRKSCDRGWFGITRFRWSRCRTSLKMCSKIRKRSSKMKMLKDTTTQVSYWIRMTKMILSSRVLIRKKTSRLDGVLVLRFQVLCWGERLATLIDILLWP